MAFQKYSEALKTPIGAQTGAWDGILKPYQNALPNRPETAAEEAQRLVYDDRQRSYGDPNDTFARVGRAWGAILGQPDIDPLTVGLMMAAFKCVRAAKSRTRNDVVDINGYGECCGRILEADLWSSQSGSSSGPSLPLQQVQARTSGPIDTSGIRKEFGNDSRSRQETLYKVAAADAGLRTREIGAEVECDTLPDDGGDRRDGIATNPYAGPGVFDRT